MTILSFDPNKLYQIDFHPIKDTDERPLTALGLGPDGVSRGLAAVLEGYLKGSGDLSRQESFGIDIAFLHDHVERLRSMSPRKAATMATIDEIEEAIACTERVASKLDFITEIISSGVATEPASNFFGDAVEEGVDDLFTDGAPRDILHLLYGFADAVPFWKLEVFSPVIHR